MPPRSASTTTTSPPSSSRKITRRRAPLTSSAASRSSYASLEGISSILTLDHMEEKKEEEEGEGVGAAPPAAQAATPPASSVVPPPRPPPPNMVLLHSVQDTLSSGEEMSVATPVAEAEGKTFLQLDESGAQRKKRKKKRRQQQDAAQDKPPPEPQQPQQQKEQKPISAAQQHFQRRFQFQQRPPLQHKMSLPTVVVHSVDEDDAEVAQHRKARKKKKKKVKNDGEEDNGDDEEDLDDDEDRNLLHERKRSLRSRSLTNAPTSGSESAKPMVPPRKWEREAMSKRASIQANNPPMAVPKILHQPPTPTDPPPSSISNSPTAPAPPPTPEPPPPPPPPQQKQQQQQQPAPPHRTRTVPLLNLPQICSPGGDDDDDNGGEPEREDQPHDTTRLHPDDSELPQAPCQITVECEVDPDGATVLPATTVPAKSKKKQDRGRKRRRSLVNILFPGRGGKGDEQAPTTPVLEAPGGERLHFRRVSAIFGVNEGYKTLSTEDLSSAGSGSPPECSGGLSIRNLFPYRRRRSSVTHLDNTEQFKEKREEVLASQRRRMSSFPPMDGDDTAVMLEKANLLRLEKVYQDSIQLNSSPIAGAFKRLRRGSRSPSPMSLFPGLGKNKKSKWKSSTDIHSTSAEPQQQCDSIKFIQQQQQQQATTTTGWKRQQQDWQEQKGLFPTSSSVEFSQCLQ